jgi:hypothetical protein
MSSPINLVAGDSGPTLILSLTDQSTGLVIDITGFTSASMKFRAVNTTTVLATLVPTLFGVATNGQLQLVPTTVMTTQPPGYYEGQLAMNIGSQLITAFNPILFYIKAKF